MSKPLTELADLSPEQREVVESWGQGMAVMAGAGSGKTTTLTIKCTELLKLNPEARFAAVSFTERSASDLRAKLTQRMTVLKEQGVLPASVSQAGLLSRHWVTTIHGLCSTVLREFPRQAGLDGEESMLSEPESMLLWERALESLWFDDNLAASIQESVDYLLTRESRDSLLTLLNRVRSLHSMGVLGHLAQAEDRGSRDLAQVANFVLERYDRLKRRRGALDFNDLEAGADRALEFEEVRRALHERFDLVLVDEFQDTNPVQARIIWRLVRPDASNLCVVGDPKQSIYRFRDADVSVFEEFCRRLPVNRSLSWNFRSRPGIIEYTNELCARAFEASEMRYDALIPKREPGPFNPVERLDVQSPAELGAWIRAENARGVPLHEMALLLRKIRGNEKWLKALTSAGIPIAVGSGGLFWSDPRVREMTALLKWWINPANSLSGAVFLRAPWMGIEDRVLDEWVKQDPTWQKPFFASQHPVARALVGLRSRIVRPGEVLQALLVSEAVEDELGAPLLGLWHRVEDLSSRNLDFQAVVTEVSLAMEQSRRERDVPPPRNQGQLSVLTLHGAKGLEFKHVILVDLGKKGRAPDSPLLFWDREKGAFLAGRDAEGERDKKDPLESVWRELEKNKNLAESKRIFYVALTRAQERLLLVCPELPEKEDPVEPQGEKVFAVDHWRAWVDSAGVSVPLVAEVSTGPALLGEASMSSGGRISILRNTATPQWVRPRHSVTEWNLLSRCERAYEWTFIRPLPLAEGIQEAGLFQGVRMPSLQEDELSQRELGIRVHACLERGDFDALKKIEREVGADRFSAEPVMNWALHAPWMMAAKTELGREVWTELPFEVPVLSVSSPVPQILVGSIDRLVCESSSQGPAYWIVDFKVTQKPKAVADLLEAYGMQMELYALGLRGLDSQVALNGIQAVLVNISSHTVQTAVVPLGKLNSGYLADRASQILNGSAGMPRPGPLCRYCDFRGQCAEGRRFALADPVRKF
ncbi:UvrD-helicase domain-containing protein [Bdellovibrionota bacterium FG-1]